MRSKTVRQAAMGLLMATLVAAPSIAFGQETLRGYIVKRDEGRLVVRTTAGDKTVILNPDTKIRGTAGAGVLRREPYPATDLIRGLAIDVEGSPAADGMIATSITFKTSNLKSAKQIQAGLAATDDNVSSNRDRIAGAEDRLDNVGDLIPKGSTKVFFAVGSSAVGAKSQQDLCSFAEQAKATRGYRLAVVGRADPTGDPEANQRLSEKRAQAVTDYLLRSCGILPGRLVPRTALGESEVTNDPDKPRTNAEARRVTVWIMVSKAQEGRQASSS
jgi:outer membrane protein OmpA-like peptidoglycan-associated protein